MKAKKDNRTSEQKRQAQIDAFCKTNEVTCVSTHSNKEIVQVKETAIEYANTFLGIKLAVKRSSSSTRSRASKSDVKQAIESMIEQACFTRKEILTDVCARYSDIAKSTVSTYLSDSKNEKYNKLHTIVVERDNVLQFDYFDVAK